MTKPLKFIIEALLFASDKPLNVREINYWLAETSLSDIRQALEELQSEYDTMGRSFVLKEVAHGYQFRTQAEYAPYILKMVKTSPARLSRAAMETLSIIAYKQPILRQGIVRLRGVEVGGILRTLLEKGLIRIMGRENLPGKPLIYGTTKKFLEVFDLNELASLPKLKEIKEFESYEGQQLTMLEEDSLTEKTVEEDVEDENKKPGKDNGQAPEA